MATDGSQLRVRTGPGSGYSVIGFLANGSQVEILERQQVGDITWGRIEKGWISLYYVTIVETEDKEEAPEVEDTSFTGTVKATSLYIRSGAGTENKILGRLYNGETVTILETKQAADGTEWGRIEKGWICMDYIVR